MWPLVLALLASSIGPSAALAQMMHSDHRSMMNQSAMEALRSLDSWTFGAQLKVAPSKPKPHFDSILRAEGERLYTQRCATCHGVNGDGRGPRAAAVSPAPRDFTKGVYEFRSTPTGRLPTDEDIWKVISNGIHGTAMVPWLTLSERDRWALVAYVEGLSNRFATETRAGGLEPPTPPAQNQTLVDLGRRLYVDAGCVTCHGAKGLGDGPAAADLLDATGTAIRPTNFNSGIFRRGPNMEDIYLALRTGLDGTPMPSYEDSLTSDQTWAVAAFVVSLVGRYPEPGNAMSSVAGGEGRRQERLGLRIDMPAMGAMHMENH